MILFQVRKFIIKRCNSHVTLYEVRSDESLRKDFFLSVELLYFLRIFFPFTNMNLK